MMRGRSEHDTYDLAWGPLAPRISRGSRTALPEYDRPTSAPEPVQPTGPAIMACDRCGSQGIAINPERSKVWYCPAGYGCSEGATNADL